MAKQVLDVHAGKGMTTSQSNEHLRNANTGERLKKWSGNYDPSRESSTLKWDRVASSCRLTRTLPFPQESRRY